MACNTSDLLFTSVKLLLQQVFFWFCLSLSGHSVFRSCAGPICHPQSWVWSKPSFLPHCSVFPCSTMSMALISHNHSALSATPTCPAATQACFLCSPEKSIICVHALLPRTCYLDCSSVSSQPCHSLALSSEAVAYVPFSLKVTPDQLSVSKPLLRGFLWLTVRPFCSAVPSVQCACGTGLCGKS